MPSLIWSRLMSANQLGDTPLMNWQYERVPNAYVNGAYLSVLQRATTVGVRTTMTSGSTTVQQRQPVQAGGTIGVTPSPLNTPVIDFVASPDDFLLILNDEVAAGNPTVDGIATIEPI